jgi:diguanylate cyclase (GGDEF)-like protein
MIVVGGDADYAWQARLVGRLNLPLLFQPVANMETLPFYGEIMAERISFFRNVDGCDDPILLVTVFWDDSDFRILELLTLVGQLRAMVHSQEVLDTRLRRFQGLWQKTRQRYRAYTKTMREKLWLDPLTQILNRDGVSHVLSGAVRDARATDAHMTVLLLDLDWFKRINDGYGHAVGDAVLRHVARLLKAGVRRTDAVGRVGGEEFCAILHGCDRLAGMGVAEKIRKSVSDWRIRISVDDSGLPSVWAVLGQECQLLSGERGVDHCAFQELALTISVGVSTFPEDFTSNPGSSRLLHAMGNVTESDMLQYMADKALYQAKKEGRDRVCSYKRGPM